MSKMVARVAAGQAMFDGRTLGAMSRTERERYYERARIAIRDMREPTETMKDAAEEPNDYRGTHVITWQAMIDEALLS